MNQWARGVAGGLFAACALLAHATVSSPAELAAIYRTEVDRRLDVPMRDVQLYARLAEQAFAKASLVPATSQYVLIVDRDPRVQVALLMWRSASGSYQLVGASPVSTGKPGTFEHFKTPTGVFEHTGENPDFRAEGTVNSNGVRGYGAKGMRVFDFGWQRVPRGWGDHAPGEMRLQMHATDPDLLEPRLGTVQSKGCVRIPATLDRLLDRYGVLDADYERLEQDGRKFWMLAPDRDPVAEAGRYLVVVESGRTVRPAWDHVVPLTVHRKKAP